MSRSFITAAIARHRVHPQGSVANGDRTKPVFNLTPPDPSLALLVKAAWAPTISGQAVPMLGEEVGYVEPSDDY